MRPIALSKYLRDPSLGKREKIDPPIKDSSSTMSKYFRASPLEVTSHDSVGGMKGGFAESPDSL